MTRRKDWAVEYQVQKFMHQVDSYSQIKPVCRKPGTVQRFWQAGYTEAMREVGEVVKAQMDQSDSPAHALYDALMVIASALELTEAEGYVDGFVERTVESWLFPVNESGY